MSTDKNKLDFNKLRTRKKTDSTPSVKKVMYKEVEQVPKAETSSPTPPPKKEKKSKVGRKSWKEEGVNYTRLSFDTPLTTKQKLKELLATKFFGVYSSQDEMMNVAIDDFIKKHTK